MAKRYEQQSAPDEFAQTTEIFQRVYMASQKLQGSSANVVRLTSAEYAQFGNTAVAWALQEASDRNWIPPQILIQDSVAVTPKNTEHSIPRNVKIGSGVGAGIILGFYFLAPVIVPKLFPDGSHTTELKSGTQLSRTNDPVEFNAYSDDCFDTGWYRGDKDYSKQDVTETSNGTVILRHDVTSFAVVQAGEQVIIPVDVHVGRVEVCGASSTLKVDGSADVAYVGPNVQMDMVNGEVTDAYLDGPNKCPTPSDFGNVDHVHTDC